VRVLDHLGIDRAAQPTDLIAVGNWRSIGAKIARMLAGVGARLVHSAPAVGVRDWSDLWIAVAAGQWLGQARPGEILEVVSDDRAFDAVADAASALGVTFKRISYRSLAGTAERRSTASPVDRPAGAPLSRGQRRRAARRRAAAGRAPRVAVVADAALDTPHFAAPQLADDEAHAASQAQLRTTLTKLTGGDPHRWISLDAVANALRSAGFTRPPGSPRLITRLRRTKDLEVSANGMVRLLQASTEPDAAAPVPPAAESDSTTETPRPKPRRPRRRRSRAPASGDDTPRSVNAAVDTSPGTLAGPQV